MTQDYKIDRWGKCYECEKELTDEQEKRSREISGLSLCLSCLEKDQKPKTRCCVCHKSCVELNKISEFNDDKLYCLECFKSKQEGGVAEMTSELADFRKRNSQFVALADGESIEATYEGFKIGPNPFDDSKEVVNYKLNTAYGLKTFRSGACGLTTLFEKIEPKTKIRITRHGVGSKTSYKIEEELGEEWVVVGKEQED